MTTTDKLNSAPLTLTPVEPMKWEPTVTVELRRYEELSKKEVLLHQIENVLNSTATSYDKAETIKAILSVLPR